MKKGGMILPVLALTLALTGCSEIRKAQESTVTVDDKGQITQVLVEDFQEEIYSKTELEESVSGLVEAYNEEAGSQAVTLDSCKVKDEEARVIHKYASDEDYREFNLVDFFAGTVEEAVNEGYSFACDFQDAGGQAVASGTVPDGCREAHVMIVREPVCVMVSGQILYASSNMEILDESRARLVSDTGIEEENAQVSTDAYGYVIYQ